jgi:hypothetical protein
MTLGEERVFGRLFLRRWHLADRGAGRRYFFPKIISGRDDEVDPLEPGWASMRSRRHCYHRHC